MDGSKQLIRPKNPRENASVFSIATFFYTIPTFRLGNKKELDENDIYESLSDYKCYKQGNKMEEHWLKEVQKFKNSNKRPSLWTVIWKCIGIEYLIVGVVSGFNEIVVKTLQVLSLGDLISLFMNNEHNQNKNDVYIEATKLILYSVIIVLINSPTATAGYVLGIKLRSVCSFIVYRKSLKLSKAAFSKTNAGQIMNIISNDIKNFERYPYITNYIWIGPAQTAVITFFLYKEVGYSAIVGVLFILLFIPLNLFMGKLFSKYRTKSAARTDERIRLMNEILLGISIIKMYTWEKPFTELVDTYRRLEIKAIRVVSYIRMLNPVLFILNTRIAVFLTLVAYALVEGNVNARQAFILTGFYSLLRTSMLVFFPESISLIAELNVCLNRIGNFLLLQETAKHPTQSTNKQDFTIIFKNVNAKWVETNMKNTLTNVNLKIKNDSVIGVIGSVGSGKTSLLYSILNELPITEGTIDVRGKISYASQEPWLFPESVRQNILFGSKFDLQRYEEVVKVCALETDFQLLPYGDNTIIGERGSSLSGGQRSRVNLARAVYRDADVYLLDDPLSAVDTHVGKEIFTKCIKGYLRHKTVILVTHQLQYLNDVDYLIILEKGVVAAQGTPEELQKTGIDFIQFLNQECVHVDDIALITLPQTTIQSKEQQNGGPKQTKEERRSGALSKGTYLTYIRSGANSCVVFITAMLLISVQGFASSIDYFIAYWVNLEQNNSDELRQMKNLLLLIYTSLITALIILSFGRLVAFINLCMKASINLHNNMFKSIVRATMRFFNTNPSGRVLNRFSKDMGLIDESLPACLLDTVTICLLGIGVIALVSIVNYWLILPAIVIATIFYFLRLFYISTSRSLKRLDGLTRSPVMSHLNYTLQGLATIRACEAQEMLEKEFSNHQDVNTTVSHLYLSISKAFGYWLDLFCLVYITLVTVSCLFMNEDRNLGGHVGLIITQCLALTGIFQWGMRQFTETENQMTAVERVLEYNEIEHEPLLINSHVCLKKTWPETGEIQFNNVSLRYFPEGPFVLKNLSFTIKPLEKVGVVGRTGAGKSSLIAALFRFSETEGSIVIDGVDISTIGLHDLRSKISIIPQEPMLFSGNMRKNLDPFVEFADDDIWKVLEEVELKDVVANFNHGLDSEMSEGGSNLSVGQRQLVCLARAMLRKNKILILDEATANVDNITDGLIQKTIRRKFADCTVLTIAHRLDTVMDSDKILVIDAGVIVEFDYPHLLLQNRKGVLFRMVQQIGSTTSRTLLDLAKNTYEKCTSCETTRC
ncbi:hypothetical protein FQR65_LT13753 [Abscondita terminalis]|nr:hypothetical protein FQR65_LT13753 [Abscondita terminalis]